MVGDTSRRALDPHRGSGLQHDGPSDEAADAESCGSHHRHVDDDAPARGRVSIDRHGQAGQSASARGSLDRAEVRGDCADPRRFPSDILP